MTLIRGTSLQGYSALTAELGGDPAALLAVVGLAPDVVGDHDTFVDYRAVATLLETTATATSCADFGRRLSQRQGLEILGPLGVAARTAATVGAALQAIEQFMAVYSPAIAVTVGPARDPGLVQLEWRLVVDRPPPHRQAAELALGVALRVLQLLAGTGFHPTTAQLRHQPLGPPEDYEHFFGCRVDHGADRYGFRFRADVLQRRLGADHAVHAVVRDYLDTIAVHTGAGDRDAVARLVRRMLPTGGLSLELVAEQLAQHPRTLQRRLASTGTTFAQIVDDVRREEAARYLRESDLPLGQLSGNLGFSEQSVLSRACRRWFGMSPREVRRSGREGDVR
ncbi:AraC family transcriptional regulator [Nocardioides caeni]|uniref:AraC family transcriptional regulator n=1 Tax=Nocardioides caeni TaxID=574700 RepID=A0A4S8NSQ6_9ACTN|nr:AraC family transcriptional regulator [Nocardioides caeni]THV18319.1 AraC family transcriptional regulator [Nocardioides caeni]